MATDTAHINLELASGRNEVTAPFHHTAQRRRLPVEEPPVAADVIKLPTSASVIIDVPLGTDVTPAPPPIQTEVGARRNIDPSTWFAFIGATLAVAAAVWWVMAQRLPDIDPREVIQRNLGDARSAMAEGRYTDPPERSAFHYYNTVLAVDPGNADAIAGIDAIADRHLTDARVMLAEHRVAEAAVALDRARRVRPQHSSLPDLDTQLRTQLRKMLAKANAALQAETAKAKVAKAANVSSAPRASKPAAVAPPERARVASVPPLVSLAPKVTEQTTASLDTPAPSETVASGSAPAVEEPVNAPVETAALPERAPDPVPTVTPKLIKMVQPEYPQEALMRGIEGWVDVSLEVNAAGEVVAPRIEDTSRGRLFNRAALNAVQQWKYEPRDGAASERLRVRLQFRYSQ